jgi:hypothetical protein
MTIMTVGIDLAKNVFSVHGVDENGKVALQRTVRREHPLELIATLHPCVIAMEACSGAHHWARQFAALGHTPKLIAPKFVTPYRMSGKRGKNDAADAAAILAKRPAVRRCVSSPSKPSISRGPCACIGSVRVSSRSAPPPSTACAACSASSASCSRKTPTPCVGRLPPPWRICLAGPIAPSATCSAICMRSILAHRRV